MHPTLDRTTEKRIQKRFAVISYLTGQLKEQAAALIAGLPKEFLETTEGKQLAIAMIEFKAQLATMESFDG